MAIGTRLEAIPTDMTARRSIGDLRRWLYAGYAIALALGVGLLATVYLFGSQIVGQTVSLVHTEMPALHRLQVARTAVQEYQTVLFEYYATGDRQRYAELSALCDARIRDLILKLPTSPDADELSTTLSNGHDELFALGGQLDRLMAGQETGAGFDTDRARELLSAASFLATRVDAAIERAIAPFQQRAEARGEAAKAVLGTLIKAMVGLGGAILAMSLAIGYFANAYIRERVERHRLATFPERNPNPVLSLDCDGRLIYANEGTRKWLGDNGFATDDFSALLPDDFRSRLGALQADHGGYARWEYERPAANTDALRSLGCGIHYLDDFCEFHLFVSDITERKLAERQLQHQALHDALTGLPNRRRFEQDLDALLAEPATEAFSVLFISVDRFSNLVQGLGHGLADQVMRALAERLRDVFAERALERAVYRFEGTMFAAVLPASDRNARDAIIQDALAALAKPVEHKGREYFFSHTLGGTSFPADGRDTATLLKNGDSALQAAARRGSGNLAWYLPAMNDRAAHRLDLETRLRHAIERNELVLHYQPQLDLASGRMIGAEALLRWVPTGQSMISPADFIPIAEESGQIIPIGEWVMRQACLQNQVWRAAGHDGLLVAVNVSAQQFLRPGFADTVRRVLAETALPPKLLELEVTESVAMDDVEATIATLVELKAIGVHLSIDDFGTGYSSLSYLKRFPIDKLKVDQSFVRHMAHETDAAAIARAVIDLGHSLRLKVIAEGVETIEQLNLLRDYGCHEMQGYFYSRPVAVDVFSALLNEGRRLPATGHPAEALAA
jgi:diguanylate cyclase (GGDEF)-like protein